MNNTYLLTNSNCVSCRNPQKTEFNLNQGKPYGSNIFNIPDSFDLNSGRLSANKFYGFSLSEFGRFVYKSNNTAFESQEMAFPNLDSLYLTNRNNNWMLGVSS